MADALSQRYWQAVKLPLPSGLVTVHEAVSVHVLGPEMGHWRAVATLQFVVSWAAATQEDVGVAAVQAVYRHPWVAGLHVAAFVQLP